MDKQHAALTYTEVIEEITLVKGVQLLNRRSLVACPCRDCADSLTIIIAVVVIPGKSEEL